MVLGLHVRMLIGHRRQVLCQSVLHFYQIYSILRSDHLLNRHFSQGHFAKENTFIRDWSNTVVFGGFVFGARMALSLKISLPVQAAVPERAGEAVRTAPQGNGTEPAAA